MMSISEGLNAGAFGAEMWSNQFGTDGRSLQLDEALLEESNVDKVPRTSVVDGLVNFEADEATSKIVDDGAPAVRGRLTEIEPGKRKSKPVKRWLAYQTSQLEGRRRKLHSMFSVNQVQWMSSYIQSEMLRLLGTRYSRLMECSRC